MANSLKAVRALTLAVALLAVPFVVDANPNAQGTTSFSVRPAAACAQATECSFHLLKICSTIRQDHRFYRCTKGCDETEAVAAEALM
ncbi:MAG: hypothetical protein F4139_09250 [Gemmatimonadetes bacterium]|nr:hypothetical protein [Gemmatimonadota bacterium]MYA64461.1 hypothetical protein [Gemmatimonadota bacterium]MYB98221.1 hypothetical protein [Gemmatimonadota bacterium]MYH53124.1 hypothetical protein [Gemmatimonadota bacterium]MYI44958.1 hypothetical protein [Gemmatimonadota bacterium]